MENQTHDDLRDFSSLCTRSLSDDAELRQQVQQELLDHLEDAFEEERKEKTEEEAAANAKRRFGNPEELAAQLSESNARRLSRHARIRRTVRWLSLPILLIAVLLCIDIRGIIASTSLLPFLHSKQSGEQGMGWDKGLKTKALSEEDRLLFDYYYGKGDALDKLSRLYGMHRDDPMFCAIYAQELSHNANSDSLSPETQARLPEVLANGKRIDPSNPLYDYLECQLLMKEACTLPRVEISPADDDVVTDRDKLDEAISIYTRALNKGQLKTYGAELVGKVRGMLIIKTDLLGGLHLLDVDARERIHYLPVLRRIVRGVVLTCDLLQKEGNPEKAVELLATWHTFLPQFLNRNNTHVVDILASCSTAKDFQKCAKRLKAEKEIADLQAFVDLDNEIRSSYKEAISPHRRGFLAVFAMPVTKQDTFDLSEWITERHLETATLGATSLGLACLVILLVIVLFGLHALAMRLSGEHPFLFLLPKATYARLFLKGILIPALLYLAISFFTAAKGGLIFPFFPLFPVLYLCLFWPTFYGLFCRRILVAWTHSIGAENHDAFRASRSLNMLCLFGVLLLSIGCILRPIMACQQRYYAHKETLVIPRDGVDTYEKRSIRKCQKRLLDLCK